MTGVPTRKLKAGHEVAVDSLPACDMCRATALYDGKTLFGPWAFMCAGCFATHGISTGVGRGQRLILRGTT